MQDSSLGDRNFTNAERIGKAKTAADLRKTPGVVVGGEDAIDLETMLKGTDGNIGNIPKEIADNLRGGQFDSFDDFKSILARSWKF